LIFGIGAATGPLLASVWRLATGPTLFYFTAAVHALLIGYVVWRKSQRAEAKAEDRAPFADSAIAAQTVTSFELADPNEARAEEVEATGSA
jgi:hypothetical protein